MAVVDRKGRVHGVNNLRVIDASIMPEITNGNLNAPTIMLAEKLVAGIIDEAAPSRLMAAAGDSKGGSTAG